MKHNNVSFKQMERTAQRAGLELRNGKGDHARFIDPRTNESMTYCRREMGTGLKCKIIKWLITRGVVLGLAIMFISRFLE